MESYIENNLLKINILDIYLINLNHIITFFKLLVQPTVESSIYFDKNELNIIYNYILSSVETPKYIKSISKGFNLINFCIQNDIEKNIIYLKNKLELDCLKIIAKIVKIKIELLELDDIIYFTDFDLYQKGINNILYDYITDEKYKNSIDVDINHKYIPKFKNQYKIHKTFQSGNVEYIYDFKKHNVQLIKCVIINNH